MSKKLERQMREDRSLKNAALALVKADVSHLKNDVSAKNVGARLASRMAAGAASVADDAVEAAGNNKGVLGALFGAVALWFARKPILSLLTDEDDEDNDDTQDEFIAEVTERE